MLAIATMLFEPNRQVNNQSKDWSKVNQPNMPIGVLAMIYGVALFYWWPFILFPLVTLIFLGFEKSIKSWCQNC